MTFTLAPSWLVAAASIGVAFGVGLCLIADDEWDLANFVLGLMVAVLAVAFWLGWFARGWCS